MIPPSEIVIEITGQCNMHCGYCTNTAVRAPHMPLSAAKEVMDQARHYQVPAIRFTGGEPLLVPDLPQMLSYAKQQKFYVLLNTNATLITPQSLNVLIQYVDNILISLQGFNSASTQEMTKAPALFEEKIKNIFLLKACLPVVRLGTVITPNLINNFSKYATLIEKIKPHTWELFRPMTGPFLPPAKDRERYGKLCQSLLKLQGRGIHAVIGNALPLCLLKNQKIAQRVIAGGQADDGHTRLVWDAHGFFKPSYFIHENLGTNLPAAWQHPFLKELNNTAHLPSICQKCSLLEKCCGGSRTLAQKIYGSFSTADPLLKN
ncbi:MAG: radical SAM protein [Candidatus Omnitrophota bacterium]